MLNIKNKLSLRDDFVSVRTVLFGYPAGPAVVNLIILIVKQYLVTNKLSQCQTKHVFKEGAIEAIVNHWRVEIIIAIKNKSLNNCISKWSMIIGSDAHRDNSVSRVAVIIFVEYQLQLSTDLDK